MQEREKKNLERNIASMPLVIIYPAIVVVDITVAVILFVTLPSPFLAGVLSAVFWRMIDNNFLKTERDQVWERINKLDYPPHL